MIPEKDKTYFISCLGPFDYNQYSGTGIFTGELDGFDDEVWYGFKIPKEEQTCFFVESEILGEVK